MTSRSSWRPPSLSARPLTWMGDSSAQTIRTLRPQRTCSAANCRVSVDFPIPGSPPTRVTDPGTRPPPRALSSSLMPVGTAWNDVGGTCVIGTASPLWAVGATITRTSLRVFHSPQPGQQPTHLGGEVPQPEHTNEVRPERARAPLGGLPAAWTLPERVTWIDMPLTIERACDRPRGISRPDSLLARGQTTPLTEEA